MSGTSLIVSDIFSILPIDTNIIKLINTENFNEKFHRQGKLGSGPQHREFQREILQTKQVGVKYINRFNSKLSFFLIL